MTTFALNRILLLVLMDLDRREGTACVSVQAGKARRAVHVLAGQVVNAESNLKAERLGDMLVSEGLLDPVLLEPVAAEAVRQGKLLGAQLVEDKLLSAEDLMHALGRQVPFRVGAALAMRGVVTVEPPKSSRPVVEVPVARALVAAFRTCVPLGAVEDQLRQRELDGAAPAPLLEASSAVSRLELGPAELRVVRRLAAGESIDGILASGAPREPVLRLAGGLRAVGLWR